MGWVLAIDFGTTATTGAMVVDGRAEPVLFDGESRMPSSVYLDAEEGLIAGVLADRRRDVEPARYRAHPKRLLLEDSVLLGPTEVAPVELVAAVLGRVAAAALEHQGGEAPAEVRLSHPASWAAERRDLLRAAAAGAGLPATFLVPEPVAAVCHYAADAPLAEGSLVGVFDLGGGTFDVALLRRTATGYDVVAWDGEDRLGGVDFDFALFAHLRPTVAAADAEAWSRLADPPDRQWQRHQRDTFDAVREAKESLSELIRDKVWVRGANCDVAITRDDLDEVLGPRLRQTVDITARTLQRAGARPDELAALYLVGGSSRIPLVRGLLAEVLGVDARLYKDHKLAVALGAAQAPRVVLEPPPPRDGDVGERAGEVAGSSRAAGAASGAALRLAPVQRRLFEARLSATVRRFGHLSKVWWLTGQVTLEGPDAVVAVHNLNGTESVRFRASTQPSAEVRQTRGYRELTLGPVPGGIGGFEAMERTYLSTFPTGGPEPVLWMERYVRMPAPPGRWDRGARDFVVVAPEHLRWLVDQLTFTPLTPATRFTSLFSTGVALLVPDGFVAIERLQFLPPAGGPAKSVVAASRFPRGDSGLQWLEDARMDAGRIGGDVVYDRPTTLLGTVSGRLVKFGKRSWEPKVLWAGGSDDERDSFVCVVEPSTLQIGDGLLSSMGLRPD